MCRVALSTQRVVVCWDPTRAAQSAREITCLELWTGHVAAAVISSELAIRRSPPYGYIWAKCDGTWMALVLRRTREGAWAAQRGPDARGSCGRRGRVGGAPTRPRRGLGGQERPDGEQDADRRELRARGNAPPPGTGTVCLRGDTPAGLVAQTIDRPSADGAVRSYAGTARAQGPTQRPVQQPGLRNSVRQTARREHRISFRWALSRIRTCADAS
jgi:hypothetical protein